MLTDGPPTISYHGTEEMTLKELAVLGTDNKIDQDAQFGQVCMRPRMWRVCSAFVAHVSRA